MRMISTASMASTRAGTDGPPANTASMSSSGCWHRCESAAAAAPANRAHAAAAPGKAAARPRAAARRQQSPTWVASHRLQHRVRRRQHGATPPCRCWSSGNRRPRPAPTAACAMRSGVRSPVSRMTFSARRWPCARTAAVPRAPPRRRPAARAGAAPRPPPARRRRITCTSASARPRAAAGRLATAATRIDGGKRRRACAAKRGHTQTAATSPQRPWARAEPVDVGRRVGVIQTGQSRQRNGTSRVVTQRRRSRRLRLQRPHHGQQGAGPGTGGLGLRQRVGVAQRASDSPAARLVIRLKASTRRPSQRATTVSGTVLMPTASAPSVRSMRISAGVSNCGPITQA